MAFFSPSAPLPRLLVLSAAALVLVALPGCDALGVLGGDDDTQVADVDLFPVELDDDWGYITSRGRMVIEPHFDWAGPFHEGVAQVYQRGRRAHGYIDTAGDFVIEPRFSDARRFSEGLAAVRIDGLWGYIDARGTVVINPQFRNPGDFHEGRAFVRLPNYSWSYIDRSGRPVRTLDTPDMSPIDEPVYSSGLALFKEEDGENYGYLDTAGEPVIPAQYPSARPFSEGRAAVKISDRWGFIDPQQRTVINPRYIEAGSFSEGLAPVRENTDTWGYADKNGRMVIEPQFDDARPFKEGRAAVQQYGLWGFVDTKGRLVADAQFNDVGNFRGGLARVRIETLTDDNDTIVKHGYIDRAGRYVWYPTN